MKHTKKIKLTLSKVTIDNLDASLSNRELVVVRGGSQPQGGGTTNIPQFCKP